MYKIRKFVKTISQGTQGLLCDNVLSLATLLASAHDLKPRPFKSLSAVLLHVSFGLLLFCFLSGVRVNAILEYLVYPFVKHILSPSISFFLRWFCSPGFKLFLPVLFRTFCGHVYFRYRVEHTGRIQSRDDHWNKLSVYRHRFNSGATLFEKSDICHPLDFVGFFLHWAVGIT